MGATIITGSFSSGDCGQTIENLRKASTRYIINENGEREVDEDHFYDGTIYPIANWKNFGDVDDINMSANEIRDKLDEIGMRLGYGNGAILRGHKVGYDLCRPNIECIDGHLVGYQDYFRGYRDKYVLLSEEYSASRGVYVSCIYSGDYDKVVNKAKERLWIYPYKRFVICDRAGKLRRASNKIRRVASTNQRDEMGKLKVKRVYNFYWVAVSPT